MCNSEADILDKRHALNGGLFKMCIFIQSAQARTKSARDSRHISIKKDKLSGVERFMT